MQTLMKCCFMQHFIWVFAVCQGLVKIFAIANIYFVIFATKYQKIFTKINPRLKNMKEIIFFFKELTLACIITLKLARTGDLIIFEYNMAMRGLIHSPKY